MVMSGQGEINEVLWIALGCGLLAFARIVMVMIQAPIFGSKHYNSKVRIGIATLLTLVAMPNLPIPAYFPTEPIGFILAILTQLVVGLAIGFASFTVMAAAQFGGEMMDIQMGLSVAASMDPSSGGASKLLMRLNFYIAMLLYLVVDGHHQLMIAIYKSFEVVPLTGFNVDGNLISHFVDVSGSIFVIGLQIASPALAALFITQVALGLLARVAPQMNVFMLSFPLNIAVGLTMFSVGLPVIMTMLTKQFDICLDDVFRTIGEITPK
ncbi:MAG: flagellar biosynthetic protein FliR [Candidatus Eremiobacteraeota bacterium]|nr:flagellar biosynthetic protein FliR [Candidatus Eremiobacteraeota bacterium]